MSGDIWAEVYTRGDARDFHARELPADLVPTVWWFEVDHAALVLGSSQPLTHIDLDACRRRDIDVIRRRSGGGAVLLEPGDAIWADVLIPTTHSRWTDDVSSSAWWLGDIWRSTVTQFGVQDATVHRSPMISTEWSRHVCFAGVGGGEVTVHRTEATGESVTSKVVGISQRRGRLGARFQCAIYRTWKPDAHSELFAAPGPTATDLRHVATNVDVPAIALRVAFMANLRHPPPATPSTP